MFKITWHLWNRPMRWHPLNNHAVWHRAKNRFQKIFMGRGWRKGDSISYLILFCSCIGALRVSSILGSLNGKYLGQLNSYLDPVLQSPDRSRFVRCWQGKTDGWASSTFHSKCDGKGPTVTIVQVGSYIFGGYTDKSWSSPSPGRYQLHIWWLDLENWLLCLDSFCRTGFLGMHTQGYLYSRLIFWITQYLWRKDLTLTLFPYWTSLDSSVSLYPFGSYKAKLILLILPYRMCIVNKKQFLLIWKWDLEKMPWFVLEWKIEPTWVARQVTEKESNKPHGGSLEYDHTLY